MGTNLLIVDDDETLLCLLARQLEVLGRQADFAKSGKEALEKVNSQEYCLILMDIHMAEMDGLETTRQIRSLESQLARKKSNIVAVTADKGISKKVSTDAGLDDVIYKPMMLEQLRALLWQWLNGFTNGNKVTS